MLCLSYKLAFLQPVEGAEEKSYKTERRKQVKSGKDRVGTARGLSGGGPHAGQCQLQAAPGDCFLDSTIAGEAVTRWWFQLLWV